MRRRPGIDSRMHLPTVPADADTEAHLASRNARQPFSLHRFGRRMDKGERCYDDAAREWGECCRAADHLRSDGGVHDAETRTAKTLRHEQTWQTKFNQAVPQSFVEAAARLGVAAQRVYGH